jgi:hypothetical protein
MLREGADTARITKQVAWMESALDLLKLSEGIFEEVERIKKDVILKQEVQK